MSPGSGLGAFGALIIPLSITALLLKDRGVVSSFLKAGATSPQTARKPGSLSITRQYMMDGPIRRRILVATGDGRYWVDKPRLRQHRFRLFTAMGLLSAGLIALGIYLLLGS
ncbi:MAG: hypothetical protein EA377_08280 [Phycisphaerales bacterium]|nr:MAG: hypothetical protein EA377_08280 [Phycisphaerales bacterium]